MELTATEKTNFLDLYMHHIGLSEVPPRYHLWSALSVMAACLGDRAWVQVTPAKRVYPNLYVFLIGPSGGGKGQAIDTAMGLLKGLTAVDVYAGMATKQAFIDYLAKSGVKDETGVTVVHRPCCYFVTEELAMAVRPGELAHDLLTLMTGLFMRPTYPITEGTRGKGYTQITEPTLNWLAGSIEGWLIKSIPKDAIEGGFLARVCVVYGQRDHSIRYPRPLYPPDYEHVREHLKQRCDAYTWVQGGYSLSPEAVALHDEWYMTRPEPNDKAMEPTYFRSDEMVYKLALLFALAEWEGQFNGDQCDHETVIREEHMQEAIETWTDLSHDVSGVVDLASASPQSADVLTTQEIIRRAGEGGIDRSALMVRASNRGLNRDRLDKALATLFEQDVLEMTQEPSGNGRIKRRYTWKSTVNISF